LQTVQCDGVTANAADTEHNLKIGPSLLECAGRCGRHLHEVTVM